MKTTNLKLSKLLKEAGYPQDTYFHWQRGEEPFDNTWIIIHTDFKKDSSLYASPTADEILDRLLERVNYIFMDIWKEDNVWFFKHCDAEGTSVNTIEADSLANAAAKMWLYLKEKGLL